MANSHLQKAPKGPVHPGFESIANRMARKQGISIEAASAELASSSRHASAKAKRKNPRLNKVKG